MPGIAAPRQPDADIAGIENVTSNDVRYVLQQVQRPPIQSLSDIEIEHGQPADRTICPHCYSHVGNVRGCQTCSGTGSVCPACRGARVVMVEQLGGTGRYLYQECPRCCDAIQVTDFGTDHAILPKSVRNPQREVWTILDWRKANGVEEAPF